MTAIEKRNLGFALMTKTDMDWAAVPFENTLDYLDRENKRLNISLVGLDAVNKMPFLIQVLKNTKTNKKEVEELNRRLEVANKHAAIVETERKSGFHTLYSHGVVSMWVGLEALVGDIIIAFLVNKPELAKVKPFCDVKLTLGEYRTMSESELSHALFREIERETKAIFQSGINKFESILRTVGLDGKVPSKRAKNLYELHNVRNVILHRAGIVDSRFRVNCPWRREKIGSRITVNAKDYKRYHDSAGAYLLELIQRTRVMCGLRRYRKKREILNTVNGSEP